MTNNKDRIIIASEKKAVVYTDGACSGNPGIGGYGVIITTSGVWETLKGEEEYTTNNRMELRAVIEAIKRILTCKEKYSKIVQIDLYTDSSYVLNGITKWYKVWKKNNWKNSKGDPVKNSDLWKELAELNKKIKVYYFQVKGHSGDRYNELADQIAVTAVKDLKNKIAEVEKRNGRK